MLYESLDAETNRSWELMLSAGKLIWRRWAEKILMRRCQKLIGSLVGPINAAPQTWSSIDIASA